MITCPYCPPESATQMRSRQAIATHIRRTHPEQWKGALVASIPSGFDIGTPEPELSTDEKREKKRSLDREYHRRKAMNRGNHALPMLSRIKFCPECGCNLEIFNIALGMAEKAAHHE